MGSLRFTPSGPSYYGRGNTQSLSTVGIGLDAPIMVPAPFVALSGDMLETPVLEAQIVAGGRSIVATVSNGQRWAPTLGQNNALTTSVLAGLGAAQSEGNGWNARALPALVYTNLVRINDYVITLTLPAVALYDITVDELLTWTIPTEALVDLSATTYSTAFPLTENPISEGGMWINGQTLGVVWHNCRTQAGRAWGLQDSGSYTDGTALLTGVWGPDQDVTGTVFSDSYNWLCGQEVELRMRSTLAANYCRGYEVLFQNNQGSNAYCAIVRWNGPLGNYTVLQSLSGSPSYGVKTGDIIRATCIGSTITAYKNGIQMMQRTDTTYTDGNPGMGFNLVYDPGSGCVGTNPNYGYTFFSASSA